MTTQDPSVLLLGTGYTLQKVANVLSASGSACLLTSRSREKVDAWRSAGWRAEQIELDDSASFPSLLDRYPAIDTVVDGVPPARGDDPARFVMHVARQAPGRVRRLVYLSTTGVFGERDGGWVDESSPCRPWHRQGEARLACESIYRSLTIDVACLRLPAIYGPGRGVETSLLAQTFRLIGSGERWTNRIHVEDLARIIARLLMDSKSLPPVLCVCDDMPARQADVVRDFCEALILPWPSSLSPEQALTEGRFTQLSNQRISNRLLRERVYSEFLYPTYKAWIDELERMNGKAS